MREILVCRTCGRNLDQPYRVYDAFGKVVQGCIDADHDHAFLIGESARWHNRKEAKAWRRYVAKRYPRVSLASAVKP